MAQESLSNEILKIYEPYFLIFPEYYKVFDDLINNIIYKDNEGSFPLQYKLFYGLMASSTIGCENLLDDFKRIILVLGGDKALIEEGLKCKSIPENIKGMATINNILAHKPWVLDWRHFACFKKGLSVFFFQSAIILTTIQRFASIISGLNLIIHNDNFKGDIKDKNVKEEKIKEEKIKEENKIKEEKEEDKKEEKKKKRKLKSEIAEEQIQKVITSVKKNYTEINNGNEDEKININNRKEIFLKYMSDLIFSYTDFNPHVEKFLDTEDFNWETNAKYFFSDYAGKEMDYLKKDFKTLETLNSESIGNDIKINIFKLRDAIEKYVTLIFGINDEKYNYHNTNLTMSVELKRLIKKLACYPELIQERELASCLEILNKKELVYLILIVTSIKQKISLTFFAKAFDDFTSDNS
jgi:hypothetical protein